MKLFTDITKLARRFNELVFPFTDIKRQLLSTSSKQDGLQPLKVLNQVARIINGHNNHIIRASVKNTIKNKLVVPELVINIYANLSGMSIEEKVMYGEKLADLVGHHEGQLRHLIFGKNGFSYKIGYIGTDRSESCTKCAKTVVHIREASKRITQVVNEINQHSAAKRAYMNYKTA